MGYHKAGFWVLGVDKDPQPNYPFTFVRGDAIEFLKRNGRNFDAIHASPPCQRYTTAQRLSGTRHEPLVLDTRKALQATGKPWVIENVEGAPLRKPFITLCGFMFNLDVYRHRIFESNVHIEAPLFHPEHTWKQAKMGRPVGEREAIHVIGNFSDVKRARAAMGIDWMTRNELREAIPPAYTEYIGAQLMRALEVAA
jgi:DNA (cytosine-5)-methyltransferase 1